MSVIYTVHKSIEILIFFRVHVYGTEALACAIHVDSP